MSKAFTKESDDRPEESNILPRQPLPPGVKNYITPTGAQKLRDKLERLIQDRPTTQTRTPEEQQKLFSIDQRIHLLSEILHSIEVISPPTRSTDSIGFGAKITVQDENNLERHFQIVGIDEIDIERGLISWRSPLAKTLLKARLGEVVKFQPPEGKEQKFKITQVKY